MPNKVSIFVDRPYRINNMNQLKVLILIAAICLCSGLPAKNRKHIQASRHIVTREIVDPKPFERLRVTSCIDVDYVQSTDGNTSMRIVAPDNLIEYVDLNYCGNELTVSMRARFTINGPCKLMVYLSSPTLEYASTGSAGNIHLHTLHTEDFLAAVNSAGDIHAEKIQGNHITLRTSSAGNIKAGALSGNQISLKVNSAGDIYVGTIEGTDVSAEICSAGNIENDRMIADYFRLSILSAGDYYGNEITVGNCVLTSRSAGNIWIRKLLCKEADVVVRSCGNVKLAGRAEYVSLYTQSSGNIEAGMLKADRVKVCMKSSGGISCWAEEVLDAQLESHSSHLQYRGDPKLNFYDIQRRITRLPALEE